MNVSYVRRLAVQVLVVVVALAAVMTSGAPAQSLGDVARQEQARRKDGAAKVYTNDDLRPAPAAATTTPETKPADGDAKASDKPGAESETSVMSTELGKPFATSSAVNTAPKPPALNPV